MHITFDVSANGRSITSLLNDRLVSLTITDAPGYESDTAEIVLDDRGYRIALPKVGATLEIALGFVETGLTRMGRYVVDGVSGEGPTATLTIKAKAADMTGAIRAPKTRAWEKKTLGDIASAIAGEHGLKAAVDAALKGHFYPYIAQTAESDINLITRLARDLDATAKPADGRLVIARKSSGKTISGAALPVNAIGLHNLSSWSWSIESRGDYKCAEATFSDTAKGAQEKVTVGSGDPKLTLRHKYASKAEAKRAAEAALGRSARTGSFSGELAGFFPGLFAEAQIDLAGIKPEICGKWTVTSVTHRLSETLTTSFEAERDPKKGSA